ncbi:MAG: sulfur carrier protein ThiS [Desulfobacterales bacterium]|nr:sulfur carrier protein ThiS [Desulfobacterales bacterium]
MIRVDKQKIPWKEGMTVSRLLGVLDDSGACVVVRIDGKVVCRPNFDKTPVPDESEVILVPMIAGG